MKNIFFRGIVVFCILLVATTMMMDVFKTDFGSTDYFQRHGYIFLFALTFFTRIALVFSSVITGGFVWWLAFLFCPRILIATLATVSYFHTNPLLVVMSWLIALGGEAFEKWGINRKRSSFVFQTYRAPQQQYYQEPQHSNKIDDKDVIEAEFTKK